MSKKTYGWWSDRQNMVCGHVIYLNTEGKEIAVTEISHSNKPAGSWPDYVARGELTKFVRSFSKPAYGTYSLALPNLPRWPKEKRS